MNLIGYSEAVCQWHHHDTETMGGSSGFLSMRIVCVYCQCRLQPDQPDNIKPGKLSVSSSSLDCSAQTDWEPVFPADCERLPSNNQHPSHSLTGSAHLRARRKSTFKSDWNDCCDSQLPLTRQPFQSSMKSLELSLYCLLFS